MSGTVSTIDFGMEFDAATDPQGRPYVSVTIRLGMLSSTFAIPAQHAAEVADGFAKNVREVAKGVIAQAARANTQAMLDLDIDPESIRNAIRSATKIKD